MIPCLPGPGILCYACNPPDFDICTPMDNTPAPNEDKGIKAIIFLQKMVGIDEPENKARMGWRCMTPQHREITLNLYDKLNQEKSNAT